MSNSFHLALPAGDIETTEKFYPTFQKSCWGEVMPRDAISAAFGKIAGHA